MKRGPDNMTENNKIGARIKLEPLGMYYALLLGKYGGRLGLSIHFKEPVDPQILHRAVNDLARRLPIICGRVKNGFFNCYFQSFTGAPPIIFSEKPLDRTDIETSKNDYAIRILYGERYVTVDSTHIFTDGRGLIQIIRALLTRYFELAGYAVDKTGIIDCDGKFDPDENEDAFALYSNKKKTSFPKILKAYRIASNDSCVTRAKIKTLDLSKIKAAAKSYNTTVTIYILAIAFLAIAADRDKNGSSEPVTARMPIDCRNFISSKTLRNFAISTQILMSETKDINKMISDIKSQFNKINIDMAQGDVNLFQNMRKNGTLMPAIMKKLIIKKVFSVEESRYTTSFSNLGIVKLPSGIEDKIKNIEVLLRGFYVKLPTALPYRFSCVTVGNALTLTAYTDVNNDDVINAIFDALEK